MFFVGFCLFCFWLQNAFTVQFGIRISFNIRRFTRRGLLWINFDGFNIDRSQWNASFKLSHRWDFLHLVKVIEFYLKIFGRRMVINYSICEMIKWARYLILLKIQNTKEWFHHNFRSVNIWYKIKIYIIEMIKSRR